MRIKINKGVIALFSLFLATSLSAEAGYKSSHKSSYRSSYKSSYSSPRSYSTLSSSSSIGSSYSPNRKPLSAGDTSSANAGSTVGKNVSALASDKGPETSVKSGRDSVPSEFTPKKSMTGSNLVNKKGTIIAESKSSGKSSQRIPGTSRNDYTTLSNAAPDNVRTIIRERERSGTNWTTLAMMYWMMSSSNSHSSSLSSSDREWINTQIRNQENNGESRYSAIKELKDAGVDTSMLKTTAPDNPSVTFSYDMPKAFKADHVWMFSVTALHEDKKQAPSCELPDATFVTDKNELFIKWKAPATVGKKTEMKCKAFGMEEVKTLVSA